MVNYYQPFLLPFLRGKQYQIPQGINRLYYHSWEDALWELLQHKRIPKGSTILVPNFHCMDVLGNIENHGYIWKMYELNEHFQITSEKLLESVKLYTPSVIVIFNACGIPSQLIQNPEWAQSLPTQTLIIEDSVQSLINPEEIKLISDKHFIMDSLRKVSPLPGSFIYGTTGGLNYKQSQSPLSVYLVSSTLLFIVFRFVFWLSQILNNGKLSNFAHHTILQAHDDIIGDSLQSHTGLPLFERIHKHFNFAKIEKMKAEQVKQYNKLFEEIYRKYPNLFYKIDIAEMDYRKLHVYPVGIKTNQHEQLIKYLNKKNINVWTKFPDCPWSQDKAVLFLPLGFHISKKDITTIQSVVAAYFDFLSSQSPAQLSSYGADHATHLTLLDR